MPAGSQYVQTEAIKFSLMRNEATTAKCRTSVSLKSKTLFVGNAIAFLLCWHAVIARHTATSPIARSDGGRTRSSKAVAELQTPFSSMIVEALGGIRHWAMDEGSGFLVVARASYRLHSSNTA
jgi:hypothetical protein